MAEQSPVISFQSVRRSYGQKVLFDGLSLDIPMDETTALVGESGSGKSTATRLLIRVVESWERLADDTLTHIREEWSDYRDVGGLRVPHRRRTSWNDGQRQTETVYSAWRAK